MTSAFINDFGLVLDIFGALLLFKYGLPASIDREGRIYRVTEGIDHAEVAKGKLYDRWGRVGLALLVTGFILQLVSNHVSP